MNTPHPLEAGLRQGLNELGLSFHEGQIAQLLAYQDWVAKWNKVYNLTAVRDPQDMLTHHLLDSLAAVAPLQRQLTNQGLVQPPRLLDVGSGAGLPGVVFAIACPELDVSCVDTVAKKALFIQQVAAALRLPNLHGIHARVEKLQQKWDVVSSRAFASLHDFTTWSRATLSEHGVWLAMKGKHPTEEIEALPPHVQMFHVEHLQVPGLNAERCIVWLKQKTLR